MNESRVKVFSGDARSVNMDLKLWITDRQCEGFEVRDVGNVHTLPEEYGDMKITLSVHMVRGRSQSEILHDNGRDK